MRTISVEFITETVEKPTKVRKKDNKNGQRQEEKQGGSNVTKVKELEQFFKKEIFKKYSTYD